MSGAYRRASQRGVALAMVIWFIAGMTLLVAGIVSHARVDSRLTQMHVARAEVIAAGDGAITLAMAERQRGYSASNAGPLISETRHRIGDLEVSVRLYPANGFVDLNAAPRDVLAALFAFSGVLSKGEALTVADNVIQWRRAPPGGQRPRRGASQFYAMEDVLRVEGVTRQLLDGVRDYAVVGNWARGAMNWSASPQAMLGLLDTLNPAQADGVAGRRSNMMRTSEGNRGQTAAGSATAFRADAIVSFGDKRWLRRRWLATGSTGLSRLPWKVVRTEPPRVVANREAG